MSSKSNRVLVNMSAAGCWLMLLTMTVVAIPFRLFVVSRQVTEWQHQGVREIPALWQLLVDLTDFASHSWYLWLPVLLFLAVQLTRKAATARNSA